MPNPTGIEIFRDASCEVWGITDGITPSSGRRNVYEQEINKINVLELLAIQYGIVALHKKLSFHKGFLQLM